MKIRVYLDAVQEIAETWDVHVVDDVNLKDFIEALEADPSIIFYPDGHPDMLGEATIYDSETYDTVSNKIVRVEVVK